MKFLFVMSAVLLELLLHAEIIEIPVEIKYVESYRRFKKKHHLTYDKKEDKKRFKIYVTNTKKVESFNKEKSSRAKFGENFFSTLSLEERHQYLGLRSPNATLRGEPDKFMVPQAEAAALTAHRESVMWTERGAVTVVKNQGPCGACWSFSAIGAIETRYFALSGVLKSFSVKECLDCAETANRNGCNGGFMRDCFDHCAGSGRLGVAQEYPYDAWDGKCKDTKKSNGLISHKITGYVAVETNEHSHIQALQDGAISVSLHVGDKFSFYEKGLLRDDTCRGKSDHAIVAVGYTPTYILAKNSWGQDWGDRGFVKFVRNYHNCNLYLYSSYPVFEATGERDTTESEEPVSYDRELQPSPKPCTDTWKSKKCERKEARGLCKTLENVRTNCKKTCGECTGSDCSPGLMLCPDGKCRHEHFC